MEPDPDRDLELQELEELQRWVAEGVKKGTRNGKTLQELDDVPSLRDLEDYVQEFGLNVVRASRSQRRSRNKAAIYPDEPPKFETPETPGEFASTLQTFRYDLEEWSDEIEERERMYRHFDEFDQLDNQGTYAKIKRWQHQAESMAEGFENFAEKFEEGLSWHGIDVKT